MPLNWLDISTIPINVLLLLEREQISWLPGWLPEKELSIVFKHHTDIAWYFSHKCPSVKQWVEKIIKENDVHRILLEHGYAWDRFEEPGDGIKRKYWKLV